MFDLLVRKISPQQLEEQKQIAKRYAGNGSTVAINVELEAQAILALWE